MRNRLVHQDAELMGQCIKSSFDLRQALFAADKELNHLVGAGLIHMSCNENLVVWKESE